MATIAAKLLFVAGFLQVSLVFSLHAKELVHTNDLVYQLNQKTNEYYLKQSMTNVFLISSPEAKRLRAHLGPYLFFSADTYFGCSYLVSYKLVLFFMTTNLTSRTSSETEICITLLVI